MKRISMPSLPWHPQLVFKEGTIRSACPQTGMSIDSPKVTNSKRFLPLRLAA